VFGRPVSVEAIVNFRRVPIDRGPEQVSGSTEQSTNLAAIETRRFSVRVSRWGHPTGTLKYAPDAFSWRPLQEDVVVVSQNTSGVNELWAKRYDNGWNNWRT
jgi:hypothetical protein